MTTFTDETSFTIEKCAADLSLHAARQKDSLLVHAINRAIGNAWELGTLVGRLQSVRHPDTPQEIITLDGKPILELWPLESGTKTGAGGASLFHVTRKYRFL